MLIHAAVGSIALLAGSRSRKRPPLRRIPPNPSASWWVSPPAEALTSPPACTRSAWLRDFLGRSGFEVLGIKGVGTQAHAAVKPQEVEALVTSVDQPDAQAIFISCTNFGTLDIIESLEKRLGKPVVTSNSASMWKMIRVAGDKSAVRGGGRLFREH